MVMNFIAKKNDEYDDNNNNNNNNRVEIATEAAATKQ